MVSDLFGLGKWADVAKYGEWIGAAFGFLAWALGHPSTGAWMLGAVLILAVFRRAWPFANVPNVDTFLGKAIVTVGLVLVMGGFAWRAADEIFGSHPAKATEAPGRPQNGQSGPFSPVPQGKAPKNSIPQGNTG